MASLNRVILIGNLTHDPQLKNLQSGTSVTNFRLAMNRRYRDKQGQDQEESCFVDVEVFGRQAETVDQYLSKGSPALVEGRLRYDQWEDRDSGEKRSKLLVRADRVQFLGGGRGSGGAVNEGDQTYEKTYSGAPQPGPSGPAESSGGAADAGGETQPGTEDSQDDIPF